MLPPPPHTPTSCGCPQGGPRSPHPPPPVSTAQPFLHCVQVVGLQAWQALPVRTGHTRVTHGSHMRHVHRHVTGRWRRMRMYACMDGGQQTNRWPYAEMQLKQLLRLPRRCCQRSCRRQLCCCCQRCCCWHRRCAAAAAGTAAVLLLLLAPPLCCCCCWRWQGAPSQLTLTQLRQWRQAAAGGGVPLAAARPTPPAPAAAGSGSRPLAALPPLFPGAAMGCRAAPDPPSLSALL